MQTFHLNSRLGFSVEIFFFFINIPTVHKVSVFSKFNTGPEGDRSDCTTGTKH